MVVRSNERRLILVRLVDCLGDASPDTMATYSSTLIPALHPLRRGRSSVAAAITLCSVPGMSIEEVGGS